MAIAGSTPLGLPIETGAAITIAQGLWWEWGRRFPCGSIAAKIERTATLRLHAWHERRGTIHWGAGDDDIPY